MCLAPRLGCAQPHLAVVVVQHKHAPFLLLLLSGDDRVRIGFPCVKQVPTEYFVLVLGRHLKYSCCLYNHPSDSLSDAERNMLGACR